MEEAYKQKFKLKNPFQDESRFKNGKTDEPELQVDDSEIFSKNMGFLQSKAADSNIMVVFNILDADRDGVLTFTEF